MALNGYLFVRNGTPDPAAGEYYVWKGTMLQAKEGDLPSEPVSIYVKWSDKDGYPNGKG